MKKLIIAIVFIAFIASLVGCMGVQGGTEQIKEEQTLGQELIDLKKAQEEGAITNEEYEKLKKQLMDKYNQ